MTYHKLKRLEESYKDLKHAMLHCDNDQDYYQLSDYAEGVSMQIDIIKDNIPVPPNFKGVKRDECGNRLDGQGRRVLLINKPYDRKFAR